MSRTSKDIENELGPRGSVKEPSYRNRTLVQEWLTLQGVPLHRIRGMRIETMFKCYNFPRYMAKVARSFVRKDRDNLESASNDSPTPSSIDMTQIERLVDERTKALIEEYAAPREPRVVEIVLKDAKGKVIKKTSHQHKQFETLLRACSARTAQGHRLNVMMVGPAGSGKTTAAEQVAKVLNVPFFFNGAVDTEYKLLGFTDANGKTVKRPFREAFSKPSVYLFDEIDGSHPNGTLPLNSALANGANHRRTTEMPIQLEVTYITSTEAPMQLDGPIEKYLRRYKAECEGTGTFFSKRLIRDMEFSLELKHYRHLVKIRRELKELGCKSVTWS